MLRKGALVLFIAFRHVLVSATFCYQVCQTLKRYQSKVNLLLQGLTHWTSFKDSLTKCNILLEGALFHFTVFQIEIKLYRTVGLNLVKSIGHFGLSSQKV